MGIFRRNPNQNPFIYDAHNTVSGRFISKLTGCFIDIFAFSVIEDAVSQIRYVYNSWSIKDFAYWQRLDDLLPISDQGIFVLNETFNVPRNTKQWLLKEYKYLEAPIGKLW